MSAVPQPDYAEFIENGGEPIRPGFYRCRRQGDAGWVEIQIKRDPTGRGEFIAVDGRGSVTNAEDVWVRCVDHPSTEAAFRATVVKKVNYTMEASSLSLQSESIAAIADALAKAQGTLTNVPRNREVEVTAREGKRGYTFTYATLDAILDLVRPVLSANGLALTQALMPAGKLLVVTTLAHSSGEWLRSYLPVESSGNSQALGSAISYAKRYAVTAMLGITAEDDDDANAADGNTVKRIETTTPPARQATPKPDAIAEFWKREDFHIPKGRMEWQPWQDKLLKAVTSAPDAGALAQLMTDNGTTIDSLRAYSAAAGKIIDGAVKAQGEKFSKQAAE